MKNALYDSVTKEILKEGDIFLYIQNNNFFTITKVIEKNKTMDIFHYNDEKWRPVLNTFIYDFSYYLEDGMIKIRKLDVLDTNINPYDYMWII